MSPRAQLRSIRRRACREVAVAPYESCPPHVIPAQRARRPSMPVSRAVNTPIYVIARYSRYARLSRHNNATRRLLSGVA